MELVIDDYPEGLPDYNKKYLTQAKLSYYLKKIVGNEWIENEVIISNYSGFKWDVAFHHKSGIFVVDYDGPEHYRNTVRIKADQEKDVVAKDLVYKIVRFPYWLQLDSITLRHFFDLEISVKTSYPHGFIDTNYFPASFCEMGVQRFSDEFNKLPETIKNHILKSLENRENEYGIEYVLPSKLRYLLPGCGSC